VTSKPTPDLSAAATLGSPNRSSSVAVTMSGYEVLRIQISELRTDVRAIRTSVVGERRSRVPGVQAGQGWMLARQVLAMTCPLGIVPLSGQRVLLVTDPRTPTGQPVDRVAEGDERLEH
jgi:hypothetical protein